MDCPDPRALAEFYCQVLGMRINEDMDGWVVIGSGPGLRQLAFQRAADWIPPRWPDPAYPQQMHLDIRVSDAGQAEQQLLALGATRVPGERETGFRVSPTPLATRSALFSATTTQIEPVPASSRCERVTCWWYRLVATRCGCARRWLTWQWCTAAR